ncbi:MAG: polyprenyl synthetase family protein [Bacteroidetes bacterium]|nr:polyprenyl synthetase family protein [Bacteroidota bacterium]
MYSFSELQAIVEQEIQSRRFNDEPHGLYAPVNYVLSLGGKRLRPVLTLASCNLFSPDISKAIGAAIGIEIFHNFTLLHDDVLDNADKRRNRPAVHVKWDINTAILSGDAMSVLAYRYISQMPPDSLEKVLSLFSDTALQVCEGQQYDMDFEKRTEVSQEEYIEMIRLKTAVLIACSLGSGAIIGGASGNDSELIYQFGINLGLAFQLQDDYLDVYGESGIFGKKTGGDILSNKKTFLLISALETADEKQSEKLKYWLSVKKFDPAEKVKAVKDIFTELNIGRLTCGRIKYYSDKALHLLGQVDVPAEKKEVLHQITEKLRVRMY